jgi:ribose-phosphate pyrophosphokinase
LNPNEVKANRVVGEVEGRVCILVDDMIDTGGTIVKAAETLFEAGAADVIVTATHGGCPDRPSTGSRTARSARSS